MESAFYPVITVENSEELEIITSYCDENKIDFQFLDANQDTLPVQMLLYIDEEDFDLFLKSMEE